MVRAPAVLSQRLNALTLVALSALVLTASAVAATQARVTRVKVPRADLTLSLPSSWRRVDATTARSIAQQGLAKENPQLSSLLAELDRPGTGLVFFAFDPKGAAKFATNLNIVVSKIPTGVTLGQLRDAAESELTRIPGRVGKPKTVATRLPGGPVVASTIDIRITNRGASVVARVTQYAFLRPGRSVVVSFTTRKSTFPAYKAAFTAAARSIRFG
ncbi:MAG: hypothetical protein U0R50_04135 [Gaiellales bacterium]